MSEENFENLILLVEKIIYIVIIVIIVNFVFKKFIITNTNAFRNDYVRVAVEGLISTLIFDYIY